MSWLIPCSGAQEAAGAVAMAAYEPVQKKPRPCDSNGNGQANGFQEQQQQQQQQSSSQLQTNDERDYAAPASALGSKTKPCTKFFSTSGCPYGEGCHFLHFVPGGIAALGITPIANASNPGASGVRNLLTAGMVSTQVAADPSLTVGGYKTRLCNRYNTPEGCRFAEKCHFAHGEADLRPSSGRSTTNGRASDLAQAYSNGTYPSTAVASAIFYGEPTPPGVTATGFGSTSITKISIEAAFAGAIIGKAGSNVKQISRVTGAKLSIREHETDPNMRNVEMEGSLEQIEQASEMVRQFLQNREVVAPKVAALGSHNFKTKMCENFVQGTCTFADRCHFAHGAHELRIPTAMR